MIGNLTALLATLKGLPLTYNRDLQEDKESVFDAFDTLAGTLSVLDGLIGTIRFRTERMAEAASDWTLRATKLAEELVRRGVPFREAHEAVGKLVAAGSSPRDADDVTLAAIHRALPAAIAAVWGEPAH